MAVLTILFNARHLFPAPLLRLDRVIILAGLAIAPLIALNTRLETDTVSLCAASWARAVDLLYSLCLHVLHAFHTATFLREWLRLLGRFRRFLLWLHDYCWR